MKPVGITVQQVGGQWYVSPVGTIADAILAALAALDKQELTDIIDGGDEAERLGLERRAVR